MSAHKPMFAALALLFSACATLPAPGDDAPVAMSKDERSTALFYKSPCRYQDIVRLPYRATWAEAGETYEGCWGVHPSGLIIAYYRGDRSHAIFSPRDLRRPQNL